MSCTFKIFIPLWYLFQHFNLSPSASTVSLKSTNVIQQDANGNKLLITNTTSTSRKVIITRKPSLSSGDNPQQQHNNQNGNHLISNHFSNPQIEFKAENGIKHELKEENNNKVKGIKNPEMDAMLHNNNNNNNVSTASSKLCHNGGSVLMSANQNHIGVNGFECSTNDNNNNNNEDNANNHGVTTSTSVLNITPINQKGIFLQQQQQQHQPQPNGHSSSGNTNLIIQGKSKHIILYILLKKLILFCVYIKKFQGMIYSILYSKNYERVIQLINWFTATSLVLTHTHIC